MVNNLAGSTTSSPATLAVASPTAPLSRSRGDFSGDAQPDVLFRDANGFLATWFMIGANMGSGTLLLPNKVSDPNYRVATTADFNGDGREDILLQHTDGTLAAWFMNGASLTSGSFLNPSSTGDRNWRVMSAGDFNSDGKPDLVFQHTDGTLSIWYLDGIRRSSRAALNPKGPGDARWRVVGSGDYNADGRLDLVFQHEDGSLAVWYLNGTTAIQSVVPSVANPGKAWRVVSVADRNQDNKPDLLFQHTNLDLAVWYMDGVKLVSGAFLTPRNSSGTWKVVGPK